MKVVDADLERGLFTGFLHLLLDVGRRLLEHLLDAGRVDAPVCDEVLERDAGDLATDGVEARERDGLGSIVDDEVDAGYLLERADVAAFPADDAALDVVRRDRDGRDRALRRVVCGHALDSHGENLAGALVCFGLGAGLDIADDAGGLCDAVLLDGAQHLLARLFTRHGGYLEQLLVGAFDFALQVVVHLLHLPLQRRDLVFALVEGIAAAVDGIFALLQTVFALLDVARLLARLVLGLLLDLQSLVFCLDRGFFLDCLCLALRIGDLCLSHGNSAVRVVFDHDAADEESDGEADNRDYDVDNDVHDVPFWSFKQFKS